MRRAAQGTCKEKRACSEGLANRLLLLWGEFMFYQHLLEAFPRCRLCEFNLGAQCSERQYVRAFKRDRAMVCLAYVNKSLCLSLSSCVCVLVCVCGERERVTMTSLLEGSAETLVTPWILANSFSITPLQCPPASA